MPDATGWPSARVRTWVRRTARAVLAVIVALTAVTTVLVVGFGSQTRDALLSELVRRSSIGSELLAPRTEGEPVFVLLVTSDRREGLGSGAAEHLGTITGQRADSIMLIRLGPGDDVVLLQLPRDLRAPVPGHGVQKLGASYSFGSASLVAAVRAITDVPVHHVVEVDVLALVTVVDRLGGVDLSFSRPGRDLVTGFYEEAGIQHLDGAAALAYARSRLFEERNGRTWIPSGAGDLGRIERQQELARAIATRAGDVGDPLVLGPLLWTLREHVAVDQELSGARLAAVLAALTQADAVETTTLPSEIAQSDLERLSPFEPLHWGSVAYLVPVEPDATRVLAGFRQGGTN